MPDCATCGEHISAQFVQVFGDKDGVVLACPSCSANAGIGKEIRQ
ncbi:DUF7563 family protein [Halorubrum ezzemoulense]